MRALCNYAFHPSRSFRSALILCAVAVIAGGIA